MVSQGTDGDVRDDSHMFLGHGQSTNGMWGMTVIFCWDVVSQSTSGDVGDDSNMFLRRGQSEYQWGWVNGSNMLLGHG